MSLRPSEHALDVASDGLVMQDPRAGREDSGIPFEPAMPRPYGSDRIQFDENGLVILDCRLPKGWIPRVEKTLTQSEFPGTAVEWDGVLYEVARLSTLPSGGTRYELVPWEEKNAIRGLHPYDEASESRLTSERGKKQRRQTTATLALLLAPLSGLLPAAIQEEIESDCGVSANLLTFVSSLPLAILGGFFAFLIMAANQGLVTITPASRFLMMLGIALAIEALARLAALIGSSKPMGSVAGWIVWVIFAKLTGRSMRIARPQGTPNLRPDVARHLVGHMMSRPARDAEGLRLPPAEPPPGIAEMDAWMVREPFAALVPSSDQLALAKKFGFDPIANGRKTAIFILAVGLVGLAYAINKIAAGSATTATWSALVVAAALCVEQLTRLARLRNGAPSGSILGFIVAPWIRKALQERRG